MWIGRGLVAHRRLGQCGQSRPRGEVMSWSQDADHQRPGGRTRGRAPASGCRRQNSILMPKSARTLVSRANAPAAAVELTGVACPTPMPVKERRTHCDEYHHFKVKLSPSTKLTVSAVRVRTFHFQV